MSKRVSKSVEPRYITIRIQYYPIDKKVVFGFFLLIFFLLGYALFPVFKQWHEISVRTAIFKQSPKVYTSPVLQALFISPNKKTTVRVQQKLPKNEHMISHGPRDKKQVALTFDADMTPEMRDDLISGRVESSYNKNIVDILNKTQTKATIFMSGMWIEQYPEVTAELAANPLFEFGNHSYSHPGFDGKCWGLRPISDDENQEEIQKTQKLLKQFTKKENKFFRFPGGCYSQKDLESAWKEGLYVVHWDSIGNDGFNDDVSKIEQNILSTAKNGSLIVLHFNGPPNSPLTDEALPKIISTLKESGFAFVKVSELLGFDKKTQELQLGDFLSNIGYN